MPQMKFKIQGTQDTKNSRKRNKDKIKINYQRHLLNFNSISLKQSKIKEELVISVIF